MSEFPRMYVKSSNMVTSGPDGYEAVVTLTETEVDTLFMQLYAILPSKQYAKLIEEGTFDKLGRFLD